MCRRPVGAFLRNRYWSRHSPGGATDFSQGIIPWSQNANNMSPNGATADFPSQRLHCLAGIQNMRGNPCPDNASCFLPNRTDRLLCLAKVNATVRFPEGRQQFRHTPCSSTFPPIAATMPPETQKDGRISPAARRFPPSPFREAVKPPLLVPVLRNGLGGDLCDGHPLWLRSGEDRFHDVGCEVVQGKDSCDV